MISRGTHIALTFAVLLVLVSGAFASTINGNWSGTVTQFNRDGTRLQYPARMVVNGNGGTIDYPTLSCGGTLSLLGQSSTEVTFREQLTYGLGRCVNGGTVSLRLVGDRIEWRYMAPGTRQISGAAVMARATVAPNTAQRPQTPTAPATVPRPVQPSNAYTEHLKTLCYHPHRGISLPPQWYVDSRTGCRFVGAEPYRLGMPSHPSISARWEGECRNGLAQGEGSVEYYWGDQQIYRDAIGVTVKFVDGKIDVIQNPDNLRILRHTCNDDGQRYVDALVQDWVPTGYQLITAGAAVHAEREAERICNSATPQRGITVRLLGSATGDGQLRACAKNPVQYLQSLGSQSNDHFVRSQLAEHNFEASVTTYLRGAAQRQAQAQAAQEKAVAEAKQQKKSEFRQNFIEKYRITQIITERDLTANPFIYKDKVVGVETKFNRMIAETEALFYFEVWGVPNPILVSDVPSTLFASKRHTLLVIRVMGTKAFKTGQGEVALPHGRFVAEYNCEPSGCDELLK